MDEPRARAGAEIGGRFLLREKLGSGTYGTVWCAEDRQLGRDVALKLLNAERRGHNTSVERFRREAEILCALDHPNIVRAFAWAINGDVAWLAMDLVPGAPLSTLLGARAAGNVALSPSEVVQILGPIADAVAHAHAHGVVHRDLKPRNVMVGPPPASHVTVLDFGVAKLVDTPKGDATTVGRLLGSLLFMSPEQLGAGAVDPRTDVFALATIAFELLTLRRPWARDSAGELLPALDAPVGRDRVNNHATILERITAGPRPSARAWAPGLSPKVDRALEAAWARVAADRTADPRELVADLARALDHPPYVPAPVIRPRLDVASTTGEDSSSRSAMRRPSTTMARLMDGVVVLPDRFGQVMATLGLMLVAIGAGWASARLSLSGEDETPKASEVSQAVESPPPVPESHPLGSVTLRGDAEVSLSASPTPETKPDARADAGVSTPRRSPRSTAHPTPTATPSPSETTMAMPSGPSAALMRDVRARVAAAQKRGDGPAIAEAADAIVRASATLSDLAQGRRVKRLADGARITAQLDALEAAMQALEAAAAP